MDRYNKLIEILKELKVLIVSPDTDVLWSNYNAVEEVLRDLDSYIERAKKYDRSLFKDLQIQFAPTGDLQEISLSSGWGYEFIELSNRFDELSE